MLFGKLFRLLAVVAVLVAAPVLRAACTSPCVQVKGLAQSSTGTTIGIAFTSSVGANHLLVAEVLWNSTSRTATVSGSSSGAFTAVGSPQTGAGTLSTFRVELFYKLLATGGTAETITATISGSVSVRHMDIMEISYTTLAFGQSAYSSTASVASVGTVGPITTTKPALLIAACHAVASACSAGSGWTLQDDGSFNSTVGEALETKTGVASGSNSATFGTGATDDVILGLASFSPSIVERKTLSPMGTRGGSRQPRTTIWIKQRPKRQTCDCQ